MPVYLDYNATTPVGEEVLDAMLPYLKSDFGNPSSIHAFGRRAKDAIEEARARVARSIGCRSSQVVFTGSGSEANNLFIKGIAGTLGVSTLAISAIEHPSIAKPAKFLTRLGWSLEFMGVGTDGLLDMAEAENILESASVVSVMLANNETGAIQDVSGLAKAARSRKIWMHTDAVQAFGKIPIDFPSLGVHAMTLSAHKIYGPKGVGALILDKRIALTPQIDGGGQESGMRSGTENVAAIVGFGVAAELAVSRMQNLAGKLRKLKAVLEQGLSEKGAVLFSKASQCLPNTTCFSFPGVDGGTLVVELDRAGYAVASGSACASGKTEPSGTLLAMGIAPDLARGAVRVTFGAESSESHVAGFLSALGSVMTRLSGMAAVQA